MEILGGRKTHIDFIGMRKVAYALSIAVCAVGLIAFAAIALGRANLSTEFLGGVAVQVKFERPVALDEARAAMDRAGFTDAELQGFEGGQTLLARIKSSDVPLNEVADRIVAALGQRFQGNPLTVESSSTIGPTVGAALKQDAMVAAAISFLAIVVYIAFRFHSWRFGVAGTAATVHDVLWMIAVFWLMGKEINLLFVVALLTIAGYSLTDTVVVFDRIRETLARVGRRDLGEVINTSINEVLSRTIVTALTTFLASASLLVWGGEVLRDFALALTVGIVVGTYSSIFVASPILYSWGLPDVRPGPAGQPARVARRARVAAPGGRP